MRDNEDSSGKGVAVRPSIEASDSELGQDDPTSSVPTCARPSESLVDQAAASAEPAVTDRRRSPRQSALRTIGTIAVLGVCVVIGVAIGRIGGSDDHHPPTEVHAASGHGSVWTCSMHPQIRMSEPGQCPSCGMDLIPADAAPDGLEHSSSPPTVTLSAQAQALAGVMTTAVVRTEPRTEVRLLGRVDYDETRLRMVTPWTDGRIDTLKVRVTGARVRKGQVVAQLYSPEVYAATRDLVVAAGQADKLSAGMHGSGALAAAAVSSAREKLRLLGVSNAQIKSIEKSRTAPKQVPIRSTFAGTVLKRNVEEGDYVKAGTALYHIADLSRVWVQIDAYESDLPHLSVDQSVLVQIDSLPNETFMGKVAFIDPIIDRKRRTARVRVEVPNDDGRLRPGMFAQAVIEADLGDKASYLVIPATAPLFTGRRSVVYVPVPGKPGTYELREVRLGARAGPVFPVLAGLSEGERVVSSGAFALDADLQLDGGRSMMTLADDRVADGKRHVTVTPQMLAEVEPVVTAYLRAQVQLSDDDLAGARKSLEALADATNSVDLAAPRATRDAWQVLASTLAGHARHAAVAKAEGDTRAAFEQVSMAVIELLRAFGNPVDSTLRVALCPMAFDSRGARWVQAKEKLRNPYYGSAMLRCGDFKLTVLPGEHLAAPVIGTTSAPGAARAGHNH